MSHDVVLDYCAEKIRQLDKHIEESIPVREDVINVKKSVEHLQSGYLDMIVRIEKIEKMFMARFDKIEMKLLGRPPAWVGIAFTIMGSTISALIMYVVKQ